MDFDIVVVMSKLGNYPLTRVGGYGFLAGQGFQTRTLTHGTPGQNPHGLPLPVLCTSIMQLLS